MAINPNTLLFPIDTKVKYTDVNGNGYGGLSDPFGVVVGYWGAMIEVKFPDHYEALGCYPEELEAVASVDDNGQYLMEL